MIQITTLKQARSITGGISNRNRKMPFYSYGLSVKNCITGSKLAKIKDATCKICYAKRNMYNTKSVKIAHAKRLRGIKHPYFVKAMTYEINHLTKNQTKKIYFRWHDSGDLQSIKHLLKLIKIALSLPKIKFWLPTNERKFIRTYLKYKKVFPFNFSERISSIFIDQEPTKKHDFNTSSTFKNIKPVNSKICYSFKRHNQCGNCRACWSKNIHNIAYKAH